MTSEKLKYIRILVGLLLWVVSRGFLGALGFSKIVFNNDNWRFVWLLSRWRNRAFTATQKKSQCNDDSQRKLPKLPTRGLKSQKVSQIRKYFAQWREIIIGRRVEFQRDKGDKRQSLRWQTSVLVSPFRNDDILQKKLQHEGTGNPQRFRHVYHGGCGGPDNPGNPGALPIRADRRLQDQAHKIK